MKELPEAWRAWWERLARGGAPGEGKGLSQSRILPLLLVAGALLMIWGGPDAPDEGPAPAGVFLQEPRPGSSHSELEERVARLLARIEGAGRVEVMIVPKSSERRVLAEEVTERTSRTEGEGIFESSRTVRPVTVQNGTERREEPVVLYSLRPEVAGVLVVADGARDPRVRRRLLEAVATLLDAPPHRVSVVPGSD